MTRERYNHFFTHVGIWGGILSLAVALAAKAGFPVPRFAGPLLIGAWGLGPPIFFWVDWVCFPKDYEKGDRDIAQHTHDLARNIWIAFVAILAYLFGVHLFGSSS